MTIWDEPTINRISQVTAEIIGGTTMPDEAKTLPLFIGGVAIDDLIAIHLIDCDTCRAATEKGKPTGLGQKTALCTEYLHLQLMRANYEGKANNIVAHTELGDEAPIRGQLE